MDTIPTTTQQLKETIAFVLLLAPDRFQPSDKLDLRSGFEEIRAGIEVCENSIGGGNATADLLQQAELAEQAYLAGDSKNGARLLQILRNAL